MSGLDKYSPDIISTILNQCIKLTQDINDLILKPISNKLEVKEIETNKNFKRSKDVTINDLNFNITLPKFRNHYYLKYAEGENIVEGYAMMTKISILHVSIHDFLNHGYNLGHDLFSSSLSINFQYHLMIYIYTNDKEIKDQLSNWVNYEMSKDLDNRYIEPRHNIIQDFETAFEYFKSTCDDLNPNHDLYTSYTNVCRFCNYIINSYIKRYPEYNNIRKNNAVLCSLKRREK